MYKHWLNLKNRLGSRVTSSRNGRIGINVCRQILKLSHISNLIGISETPIVNKKNGGRRIEYNNTQEKDQHLFAFKPFKVRTKKMYKINMKVCVQTRLSVKLVSQRTQSYYNHTIYNV